ncbi:MAG: hypothetical protein K1X57_01935 [Gemmataceae bacterium]|nr:hypothetical protein [Gemmataceae bacterium]
MAPATEKTVIPLTGDLPPEPERIALRSSLPPSPAKAAAPKLQVPELGEVLPPRNPFADLTAEPPRKLEPRPEVKPEPKPEPKVEPKVEAKPKSRLPKEEPAPAPAVLTVIESDADVDRVYFPSRSMLPEITLCGIVCAGWLYGVMPMLSEFWQSPEVFASVPGAACLFVFVQWLYGIIGGGYRLTKTQLLRINAGPIPDPEPVELARLATVTVEQSGLDWWLAVGQVRLKFERDTDADIVLGPISWPKRRAKIIEDAARAAREGTVVGGRVAA